MLSETDRQLLTAYLDDELGSRQRKAALRLLRRSSEARTLLRQLQKDSRELRALPHAKLAPDFAGQLLTTIEERGLNRRRPIAPPVAAIPIWTAFVAAASVLLVVGLTSFLYFAGSLVEGQTQAKKDSTPPPQIAGPEKKDDSQNTSVVDQNPKKDPEKPNTPDKKPNEPVVRTPDKKPNETIEKTPEKDPVTAPGMEIFQPGAADVALPALFKLRELSVEATRTKLQQELTRHNAYYLELLCQEGSQAFPQIQAALNTHGIELLVDQVARDRQRQADKKTNYLLFLEDVTPEELNKLLQTLAVEDAKVDKKNKVPNQFAGSSENLIVCRLTPDHRKKLATFLGVDPQRVSKDTGLDIRKPIEDQTIKDIAKVLDGKKPARQALALAYNPIPPRPQSAEVAKFLANRKPAREGTVQVLLILRGKS